jgi:hypothetical protein
MSFAVPPIAIEDNADVAGDGSPSICRASRLSYRRYNGRSAQLSEPVRRRSTVRNRVSNSVWFGSNTSLTAPLRFCTWSIAPNRLGCSLAQNGDRAEFRGQKWRNEIMPRASQSAATIRSYASLLKSAQKAPSTVLARRARPANALADLLRESRPFTITSLRSKLRGRPVPYITAGALIVLGTGLFFVFAG